MQDVLGMIAARRRPRVLIDAARHGANAYRRDAALPRILRNPARIGSGEAVVKLLDIESSLDDKRRARLPSYSMTRHVEVMSALLAEARLLREAVRDTYQPKASGSESLIRAI